MVAAQVDVAVGQGAGLVLEVAVERVRQRRALGVGELHVAFRLRALRVAPNAHLVGGEQRCRAGDGHVPLGDDLVLLFVRRQVLRIDREALSLAEGLHRQLRNQLLALERAGHATRVAGRAASAALRGRLCTLGDRRGLFFGEQRAGLDVDLQLVVISDDDVIDGPARHDRHADAALIGIETRFLDDPIVDSDQPRVRDRHAGEEEVDFVDGEAGAAHLRGGRRRRSRRRGFLGRPLG